LSGAKHEKRNRGGGGGHGVGAKEQEKEGKEEEEHVHVLFNFFLDFCKFAGCFSFFHFSGR